MGNPPKFCAWKRQGHSWFNLKVFHKVISRSISGQCLGPISASLSLRSLRVESCLSPTHSALLKSLICWSTEIWEELWIHSQYYHPGISVPGAHLGRYAHYPQEGHRHTVWLTVSFKSHFMTLPFFPNHLTAFRRHPFHLAMGEKAL